ncbi:MAG: hypothetical protein K2G67_03085 [Muribaculaceae bacterium]|nr:hypothetical protein [Muribaculaceae bacterium]
MEIEVIHGLVDLSNDTIKEGGQAIIKAKEIVLQNGFMIEKGGQLSCEIL